MTDEQCVAVFVWELAAAEVAMGRRLGTLAQQARERALEYRDRLWTGREADVRQLAERFRHYAARVGHGVDDLVQSAYIEYVENILPSYDPLRGRQFWPFMYQGLTWHFIDIGRKGHWRGADLQELAARQQERVRRRQLREDTVADIQDLLDHFSDLDESKRQAFRQRYLEGATLADVAQRLGRSVSALSKDLSEMEEKCRRYCREHGVGLESCYIRPLRKLRPPSSKEDAPSCCPPSSCEP
jgi:RNA polymerase sigma factor (sigma-70 family)